MARFCYFQIRGNVFAAIFILIFKKIFLYFFVDVCSKSFLKQVVDQSHQYYANQIIYFDTPCEIHILLSYSNQ